jgi:hypothetical protein
MRTDQSKRFSVAKGMILALVISLAMWLESRSSFADERRSGE